MTSSTGKEGASAAPRKGVPIGLKLLLVVALFGGAILWARWKLKSMFDVPPERLYEEMFATPISRVRNLTGGGFWFQGGSAWVRFESSEKIELSEATAYQPGDVEATREDFLRLWPSPQDREILADASQLVAVYKQLNTYQPDNRNTLLFHPGKGVYYFRTLNAK